MVLLFNTGIRQIFHSWRKESDNRIHFFELKNPKFSLHIIMFGPLYYQDGKHIESDIVYKSSVQLDLNDLIVRFYVSMTLTKSYWSFVLERLVKCVRDYVTSDTTHVCVPSTAQKWLMLLNLIFCAIVIFELSYNTYCSNSIRINDLFSCHWFRLWSTH